MVKKEKKLSPIGVFKDYHEDYIFNWACAIEPEISVRLCLESKHNDVQTCNDQLYVKGWIRFPSFKNKKIFKNIKWHFESKCIYEINNMHKLCKEEKKAINDFIRETYSQRFPLWLNGYISGWIHFHCFLNSNDYWTRYFSSIPNRILEWNFYNSLLWMKKHKKKWSFYSRKNNYPSFSGLKYIPSAARINGTIIKNDFLPWVEFRLNNVYDFRLYWYYIGLLLLSSEDIKLGSLWLTKKIKTQMKEWCKYQYKDRSISCDIAWNDIYNNIHIDSLEPQCTYEDINLEQLAINMTAIISMLRINLLHNAANALIEYLEEYDIPWVKSGYVGFNWVLEEIPPEWIELTIIEKTWAYNWTIKIPLRNKGISFKDKLKMIRANNASTTLISWLSHVVKNVTQLIPTINARKIKIILKAHED